MEEFNPEKFLILVVDDVSQNLQVVVAMLDVIGYSTTFATSGKQALERVKAAKPDLILLDLMMPEINGLQVCEILKSDPETREIPVIFLSASNEKDDLLQAFEEGAVDYITKPFNPPELLARVRIHLELKHTRDELRTALIEKEKMAVELEKLATTDPLTGIANRRSLIDFGRQEFDRSSRYHHSFSVLLIDIDHFKNINDHYGHAVGDLALKATVNIVLNCLRKTDQLGRFGGEEFVVVLPETEIKIAFDVAERIRQTLAETPLPVVEPTIQITVSIGVAMYNQCDQNLDALLKRADQALYQAKQQGRNQVVMNDDADSNLLS